MAPGKIGRFLAKILFIDLDYRQRNEPEEALKSAAESLSGVERYSEQDPSIRDFIHEHWPTGSGVAKYIRSLFPFLSWIFHYNLTWLLGDFIAGKNAAFSLLISGFSHDALRTEKRVHER
jgi:sodium-independent sulfate anion transporter 11